MSTPFVYDLIRVRSLISSSGSSSSSSSPALSDRVVLVSLASCAARSERWEDVTRIIRELIRSQFAGAGGNEFELSDEERGLLVNGYKNLFSNLRQSARSLKLQVEDAQQEQTNNQQSLLSCLSDYRSFVERELIVSCTDAITLLESTIMKTTQKQETKVFIMKFVGDLYRYCGEIGVSSVGSSNVRPEQKAIDLYGQAYRIANSCLDPTSPSRLGVALNYSVCLYELMHDKKMACEMAKAAFDQAIAKLDDLDDHNYKESTLLMQLLRDNLTLWTAQDQDQQA